MEHAGIEVFLGCQMPHTGHERLPERPIIGPSGKDFVHGRVMTGRLALGVLWHGHTLPLHPGVEHPQDEIEDPLIAQFALWTALGYREVRPEKRASPRLNCSTPWPPNPPTDRGTCPFTTS